MSIMAVQNSVVPSTALKCERLNLIGLAKEPHGQWFDFVGKKIINVIALPLNIALNLERILSSGRRLYINLMTLIGPKSHSHSSPIHKLVNIIKKWMLFKYEIINLNVNKKWCESVWNHSKKEQAGSMLSATAVACRTGIYFSTNETVCVLMWMYISHTLRLWSFNVLRHKVPINLLPLPFSLETSLRQWDYSIYYRYCRYGSLYVWTISFFFCIHVCSPVFTAWLVWTIKKRISVNDFFFMFPEPVRIKSFLYGSLLTVSELCGGRIFRWARFTVLISSPSGMSDLEDHQGQEQGGLHYCSEASSAHANDQTPAFSLLFLPRDWWVSFFFSFIFSFFFFF